MPEPPIIQPERVPEAKPGLGSIGLGVALAPWIALVTMMVAKPG